jgi:hypothetical protein
MRNRFGAARLAMGQASAQALVQFSNQYSTENILVSKALFTCSPNVKFVNSPNGEPGFYWVDILSD